LRRVSFRQFFSFRFCSATIRGLAQKPFSLLATVAALSFSGLALFNLSTGNLYVARLNYVDATSLIMVAILIFRAVTKLHSASDLETISITLVSSLSFVFSYEAIYKWSFYIFPWKIPAPELRELLLQAGVGLTLLTGFAQQVFKLSRVNRIFLDFFFVAWLFWLAVGFPQLWSGINIHESVIVLPLNRNMIYVLNRVTKIMWFMFYYLLYT